MYLSNKATTSRTLPERRLPVVLRLLPLLLALALMISPRLARAWIEMTVLSDDIRVQVERDGTAVVEHALMLRIRGSQMRVFQLSGTDSDAVIEGEAMAYPVRDGATPALEEGIPLTLVPQPEGGIRIEADAATGIAKGEYLFRFKYRTDLVRSSSLERDGSMVRLRWMGPRFPNGVDSAKAIIVLPTSPGEPRAGGDRLDGDLGLGSDSSLSGGAFLTTVNRYADRDEIELVRPHVSKAEQVAWSVLLDPRALGAVNDPRVKPSPSTLVHEAISGPTRDRQVFLSVAAGLCVLFTALTAIKGRQVELHARAAQVVPRPFIRLPINVRAMLAGPAVAIGVGMQLLCEHPAWGTLFLLIAMALMAHRTPLARPIARGPGRWLPISDADAFVKAPRARDAWLDVSTRGGKIALALSALVLGAAGYAIELVSPFHASLLAIDASLLVALFFTGRVSEMAPTLARGPIELLRRASASLRKNEALRVVPWARFAQGSAEHDELRLLVMPRRPVRGLNAIELGCAFLVGEGSVVSCPEVLVRVAEESEAEERARRLVPYGRWVKGRRAGERVLSIEPRLGGWKMASEMLRTLAAELTDVAAKKTPGSAPTSAAKAAGSGENAANAGAEEAPFHVTDAAWSA